MFLQKRYSELKGYDHGIERMSPDDDVVRIGYRTTQEQVEEMINAGVQLAKARGEVYYFGGDVEDDDDVLTAPVYADDPVDTRDMLELQRVLKQQRAEKLKSEKQQQSVSSAPADNPPFTTNNAPSNSTSPESDTKK